MLNLTEAEIQSIQNDHFPSLRLLYQIFDNYFQLAYPSLYAEKLFNIILPNNKFSLPNNNGLYILLNIVNTDDFSNVNTTQNINLPNETIRKTVRDTISIDLTAYTNDRGINLAFLMQDKITMILNTQKAELLTQEANMRIYNISKTIPISQIEKVENLIRINLQLIVTREVSINTIAEYYDDITQPNGIIQN